MDRKFKIDPYYFVVSNNFDFVGNLKSPSMFAQANQTIVIVEPLSYISSQYTTLFDSTSEMTFDYSREMHCIRYR